MILVLGLGNPGPRFSHTRHNVGFDAVHLAAERLGVRLRKPLFKPYRIATTPELALVTPLTYMNRSGAVLPGLMRRYSLTPDQVLIVFDNMDLEPGTMRLKLRGRSRSHNGVASVMDALGTGDFPRLSIGVGRPSGDVSVVEHVLSVPDDSQARAFAAATERAAEVIVGLEEATVEELSARFGRG